MRPWLAYLSIRIGSRGENLAWIVVLSDFPEYCRDRECETQKASAPDQDIKTIGFCQDF